MSKKNIEKRLENLENDRRGAVDHEEKVRALEMEAIDLFIAAVDTELQGTGDPEEAEKRLEEVNDELRALGREPFIEVFPDG